MILLAFDSFKGSMSAAEACAACARGLKAASDCRVVQVPLSDGGEGLVDAVLHRRQGRRVKVEVSGPLGDTVSAAYAILAGGTAVIEMAQASGLRPGAAGDPLAASTRGTGQLMRDALDRGCRKLIVGLGGSATNDGGMGMAAALGWRFLDHRGDKVPPTGAGLASVERIDAGGVDPRLAASTVVAACDVDNPLYGPRGAAEVYAPQKGASATAVRRLDAGLRRLAEVIAGDLDCEVAAQPGAGAAGGLGAGLLAFAGARSRPGIEVVMELVDFPALLAEAELLVTGEGRVDGQTLRGKVPHGVLQAAATQDPEPPVILLAGAVEEPLQLYEAGFAYVRSLLDRPMAAEQAIKAGEDRMESAGLHLAHLLSLARRL